MALPKYEVFAIRYAENPNARVRDNFIGGQSDAPMPLDYFVWLVRGQGRAFVVDTGFDQSMAKARGRTFVSCPGQTLARLGVAPETVTDVVLTHLHYDHAGNLGLFPNARFHVQEAEMAFATGRCMTHDPLSHAFEADHVAAAVRLAFEKRMVFWRGDGALAPGLSLHLIGGHTDGLQVVRIHTARGWIVLASDATHFYANMVEKRCFPIVYNVGDMLAGFEALQSLADGPDHIVPGHDPQVLTRYPSVVGLDGVVARLDAPPRIYDLL